MEMKRRTFMKRCGQTLVGLLGVLHGTKALAKKPDVVEDRSNIQGKKLSVGEAVCMPPQHPNCRCAMLPVIDDKVISKSVERQILELTYSSSRRSMS